MVTVGRSDTGILRPVVERLRSRSGVRPLVVASGAHASWDPAEPDALAWDERVEMLLASDTPEGIVKSMGVGLLGYSQLWARLRPDLLLVAGDRFETHAAGLSALPFCIPVAHLHGGELTLGAFDDALRHSLTKLSHLHFVASQVSARRVIQMGEEPWRVTVSGAPALDGLLSLTPPAQAELEAQVGMPLSPAPLLVTFHPATLEAKEAAAQTGELLAALDELQVPLVVTLPNADTAGRAVRRRLLEWVQGRPRARAVEALGTRGYAGMLHLAAAMVGNSSSGLIEAPSFALPAVNVGSRQEGRERAANVIDVACTRAAISAGLRRALDPAFRAGLKGLANPYGDGHAAERIAERLAEVPLDDRLLRKRFHAPAGDA